MSNIVCAILLLGSFIFNFEGLESDNKSHPLHVSLTNIDYNQTEKKFEIVYKIFIDDLELLYFHRTEKALNISETINQVQTQDFFTNYIKECLSVNDGKEQIKKLKHTKSEFEQNTLVLHFEIPYKRKKTQFTIANKLFFDIYPDQRNVTFFRIGYFEGNFICNPNETSKTFLLKKVK